MRVGGGFTLARPEHKMPQSVALLCATNAQRIASPITSPISGDVRVFSEERHVSEELRNRLVG